MAESNATTNCRLLLLSGELRNRIYRAAIVRNTRIVVGPRFPHELPLLSTCRQIRKETLRIFYTENQFELEIIAFQGAITVWWKRLLSIHAPGAYVTGVQLYGPPSWPNLLVWLKDFHQNRAMAPFPEKLPMEDRHLPDETGLALWSAFKVAEGCADLPWADVERLLEVQHIMLARLHPGWL